jgi:hypothetical protein
LNDPSTLEPRSFKDGVEKRLLGGIQVDFHAFVFPLVELRCHFAAQIIFISNASLTKPDCQVTTLAKDLGNHAYLLRFLFRIVLSYGDCVDPEG